MNLLASIMAVCVLLVATTCERRGLDRQPVAHQSPTSSPQSAPTVVVQTNAQAKLGQRLELKWSLYNAGDVPIYIYSSLLNNTAGAEIAVDPDRKLIELRFLRLNTINVGVNDFLKAEFLRLEPKETRQGHFSSRSRIGTEELSAIGSGAYQLQILIAYGNEIASVQKALEKSLAVGLAHPINPIVRWQKIAYSEPTSVTFSR